MIPEQRKNNDARHARTECSELVAPVGVALDLEPSQMLMENRKGHDSEREGHGGMLETRHSVTHCTACRTCVSLFRAWVGREFAAMMMVKKEVSDMRGAQRKARTRVLHSTKYYQCTNIEDREPRILCELEATVRTRGNIHDACHGT